MRRVTIEWAGETFRIPANAQDYQDYAKGTKARREMFRLQDAVAHEFGQWLRGPIPIQETEGR